MSFSGERGEYVSDGRSWAYTSENAAIAAGVTCSNNAIQLVVQANGVTWGLGLSAPRGSALTPGVYEGATTFPVVSGSGPGISLVGDGRGCGHQQGRFVVTESIIAPDASVERFSATFEQWCVNKTEKVRGEIRLERTPYRAPQSVPCPL